MVSRDIKDIAGLGEIIGHLKDFILRLIELWTSREEGKIKKQRLKLENTREFLELAKKYNLTPEQLNNYVILANDNSVTLTDQSDLTFKRAVKIKSRRIKSLSARRLSS